MRRELDQDRDAFQDLLMVDDLSVATVYAAFSLVCSEAAPCTPRQFYVVWEICEGSTAHVPSLLAPCDAK
jgi:hypothetical protein